MSDHLLPLQVVALLKSWRLGTFYNAIPGSDNKARVKEWAWEHYPDVYGELLKLGQYQVVRYDEDGEEEMLDPQEAFFHIGPLGRDVEP